MKILILFASLLFVTIAHGQKKEIRRSEKSNAAIAKYSYPVDERTGLISYERSVSAPGLKKETIYKRLNQFVATQNYGRTENIRCQNNTNVTTAMFDKDILYKDPEDGKIVGNGFIQLHYTIRSHYNYFLVFKYTLQAKDESYKYQFTDFKMLEFLSAPKSRSRGGGMGTAVGGAVFTSTGGTTTFSSASMTNENLEDFITRGCWQTQDGGHNAFIVGIKKIFGDLKEAVTNE